MIAVKPKQAFFYGSVLVVLVAIVGLIRYLAKTGFETRQTMSGKNHHNASKPTIVKLPTQQLFKALLLFAMSRGEQQETSRFECFISFYQSASEVLHLICADIQQK